MSRVFEYVQGGNTTTVALEYDPSNLQVHVTDFSAGVTQYSPKSIDAYDFGCVQIILIKLIPI